MQLRQFSVKCTARVDIDISCKDGTLRWKTGGKDERAAVSTAAILFKRHYLRSFPAAILLLTVREDAEPCQPSVASRAGIRKSI